MSRNKILFIISIFVLSNNLRAENTTDEEYPSWDLVSKEIQEKCHSLENISLPPHPQTLEALNGCEADELYYGFSQIPDYGKALSCAQATKAYDILTMLYANGKGVNRNLDVAIYYACKFGGAPAELEARVKHLIELQKAGKQAKDFDICDDITSGYMMGQCAHKEARFEDAKKQKQYASLMSNWTPEERKGFEKLQKDFKDYLEARIDEIDVSGTVRASLQIGEENSLKDRFLKTLKECAQNKIPNFTSTQYQEADRELNTLYKKALTAPYFEGSGINSEGIKKTERAWLKYRDSWVAFGHLKCPKVTEDSWKTLITKERIKELQELTEMGRNE